MASQPSSGRKLSSTVSNDLESLQALPLEIISRVFLSLSPKTFPSFSWRSKMDTDRICKMSYSNVLLFRAMLRIRIYSSSFVNTRATQKKQKNDGGEKGYQRNIDLSRSQRARERDSAHVEKLPVFHSGYLSISRNPCLNQHLTYEKGRLRRHPISLCASPSPTRNAALRPGLALVMVTLPKLPARAVSQQSNITGPYLTTSSLPREAPLHHKHLRRELSALRPEADDGISVRWRMRRVPATSILLRAPSLRRHDYVFVRGMMATNSR